MAVAITQAIATWIAVTFTNHATPQLKHPNASSLLACVASDWQVNCSVAIVMGYINKHALIVFCQEQARVSILILRPQIYG